MSLEDVIERRPVTAVAIGGVAIGPVHELLHAGATVALDGRIRKIDWNPFDDGRMGVYSEGLSTLAYGITALTPSIILGALTLGAVKKFWIDCARDGATVIPAMAGTMLLPPLQGALEIATGGYQDHGIGFYNFIHGIMEAVPAIQPYTDHVARHLHEPITTIGGTVLASLAACALYKGGQYVTKGLR